MHPQVSICNKVSTYQPFTKENPKQTRHNPKLKKSPPPSAGTNHTPSSPPPRPSTPQIRIQIRKSTPRPLGPPPYPRTTRAGHRRKSETPSVVALRNPQKLRLRAQKCARLSTCAAHTNISHTGISSHCCHPKKELCRGNQGETCGKQKRFPPSQQKASKQLKINRQIQM